MNDEYYMRLAYEQAVIGMQEDEVPVGAIIVKDGKVIASTHNQKEQFQKATGHAEILAIEKASYYLKSWHLDDCTMYVTLEPCMMCTGAIIQSRINRVVIGSTENRWPGMIKLLDTHTYNHLPEISICDLNDECRILISSYFKDKRK